MFMSMVMRSSCFLFCLLHCLAILVIPPLSDLVLETISSFPAAFFSPLGATVC